MGKEEKKINVGREMAEESVGVFRNLKNLQYPFYFYRWRHPSRESYSFDHLTHYCPIELFVMMEMFYMLTVQYGSHKR